jgi:hypothetical protein
MVSILFLPLAIAVGRRFVDIGPRATLRHANTTYATYCIRSGA